ncbi:hypothetical protein K458DRAFT_47157 [Lentithecium fluviatile CBS 122367]|uniref:DUF8035 domain-containing protein n=1 Tax=Lentithecium fluviatile CBS 122367 TaxID=1168545 RepID=A0A6G1IZX5_9PLEO|nr:hypothetical protein K458DRAFT_47157 [Lentithecium fluviatile CBS 122367]
MAALAAILPIVSRSSTLALELYRFAATESDTARDLIRTAKSINNLALIVKQVGTIIKEDDRLLSAEAIETLDDIVDQCTAILREIEFISSHYRERVAERRDGQHYDSNGDFRLGSAVVARLHYLVAHLDSLKATLSVMLQTLYTAQSIIWSRVRPTISPNQVATAVANEKHQLETLIIEQQMSILMASKLYEPSRPDAHLLMEDDSSQCLVAADRGPPQPAHLFKYQDRYIASLDTYKSNEEQWLPHVCGNSRTQVDRLLDRWSRLQKFEEEFKDAEQKERAEKRETQQPFVESDSEEDILQKGNTPVPRQPGSVQPLFTETATLPIPVPNKSGPTAPLSPASSYGISPMSLRGNMPMSPSLAPVSPRTSIGSLPVEAAAAVEAKDRDDDIDLEIPWTLYTRRHYWKYIDGKVQDRNTDQPPSEAWSDRQTWTEILASWVCEEAIKEAGYRFTRLQKERRDGRRTKFETCYRIEKALTFDQVRRLVERTVEMYRKKHAPTPPPPERRRRESLEKRGGPKSPTHDRDRTPLLSKPKRPSLEKSVTAFQVLPPPPLDRSLSMPGPIPTYPANPRATNLILPLPPSAASPQVAPYSPHTYSPQSFYPPPQPFPLQSPTQPFDPRLLQPIAHPQSPLRSSAQSRPSRIRHDNYYSSTSESDSVDKDRDRKHRSRSRRPSEHRHKKKGHEHSSGATKALMGVAGLTALLDGLVGV